MAARRKMDRGPALDWIVERAIDTSFPEPRRVHASEPSLPIKRAGLARAVESFGIDWHGQSVLELSNRRPRLAFYFHRRGVAQYDAVVRLPADLRACASAYPDSKLTSGSDEVSGRNMQSYRWIVVTDSIAFSPVLAARYGSLITHRGRLLFAAVILPAGQLPWPTLRSSLAPAGLRLSKGICYSPNHYAIIAARA